MIDKRLKELNHGRREVNHRPGDLVLLIAPFSVDKLAPRLLGPFEVIEPVGTTGLLLENIDDKKRVTASRRSIRGFVNRGLSREELIDLCARDKLQQLVEAIMDSKRERRGKFFLVKWFGDPTPSWEPEYVVRGLRQLDDYLQRLQQ